MKLEILKKVEKEMPFNSRSWNYQKIIRYLLQDENGRIIESMVIWHIKDNTVVEFLLELSNMYNCPVGCQFCASGALDKAPYKLTSDDFWQQVNIMLQDNEINPYDYNKFCVSFTGIGEPSVAYKDACTFMQELQEKYTHATFIIGTFGYNRNCFNYWLNNNVRIKTLQIPFYTHDKHKLQKIVTNLPKDYSFLDTLNLALNYKDNASFNKCKVKVNYLAMHGINDSNDNIQSMIDLLSPFKEKIEIRISFLNYTKQADKFGYVSPSFSRLKEIELLLKSQGFECYSFGTENNYEIACGQLVQNEISKSDSNIN